MYFVSNRPHIVIPTYIRLSAFLLIAFAPVLSIADQSTDDDDRAGKNAYLFNEATDSFEVIPKTEQAVDSLLAIGFDNLEKNSGISFQAARQAESIATEIQYKEGLAGVFNLLGNNYLDFGDHEMANTYYLKAIRTEEELGNDRGIASALNNLSLIYVEQEDYDTAAEYLEESIKTWQSLDEDYESLISTNNLGVIHRRQGNYEKALDYFWETSKRAILTEEPDSISYIIATLNIGNTYRNLKDYTRARIHLDTAIEYLKRHKMTSHMIFSYIVMGNLYYETDQPDKAIEYTLEGLRLAESEGMRDKIKEGHELLATIYRDLGEYSLAFHHFQLFHMHYDTLQSMQRGEKISELQARFDVEQKDREIEILNKEAELREANLMKMNQLRSFLIAGVVILFLIVALLYNSNRNKKLNNKNLEAQRREIEEKNSTLSRLNSEKDEFMSIAAHDLRNPLSSINLAVDLIEGEENPKRKTILEYTELIKVSSNRMIALINDVLKIHTIDAGDTNDLNTPVEVNPLIEEALQHFFEPAKSKQIKIKTVLSRSLDQLIGNPDYVLRILDNLISNAIKYSPKNSSVIVSSKQVNSKIRISIRDQGPGIDPNEQDKLFKKFSKLSNKPTGGESSTGLGLYIVKKICTTLNGSVRCESEPGCGSTFIVELPSVNTRIVSGRRPAVKNRRRALG